MSSSKYLEDIGCLWDRIKDVESPYTVFFCTDSVVFASIPFRIWWVHGRYSFDDADKPENSKLIFDVPDEVWRRVQSRFASKFKKTFFGGDPDELLKAVRSKRDDERVVKPHALEGNGFTTELIQSDDWPALRRAIEATAAATSNPQIDLHGGKVGRIRVIGTRIEINIESIVGEIIGNWQSEICRKLGIPNR